MVSTRSWSLNAGAVFSRARPVWSSTFSFGANRAASCFQLNTSDFGTTTSAGPFRFPASRASTCTVLPSPMSSARHPPKPKSRRNWSHPSPSRWYSRSSPRNAFGGSTGATPSNCFSRSRARANCASNVTSGRDASSASSTPTCACENRTLSPSTVPMRASSPYFFSHSSGTMPTVPSSRAILVSPRPSAASSCGNATACPPKSAVAFRSNQSRPERTASLNAPAWRYSFPSASTCQPAATSSRTSFGSAAGRSWSFCPPSAQPGWTPSRLSRCAAAASAPNRATGTASPLGGRRRAPATRRGSSGPRS